MTLELSQQCQSRPTSCAMPARARPESQGELAFASQPMLMTGRLRLRKPQVDDSRAIAGGLGDFAVARMLLPLPQPYHPDDALDWILGWRQGDKSGWSHAITLGDGPLIGVVSIEMRNDQPQLGYWLSRQYWGRGIMTEAVNTVLTACFDTRSATLLQSGVIADNPASLKLQDRLGFSVTGVKDAWCNPRSAMVNLITTEIDRAGFTPL